MSVVRRLETLLCGTRAMRRRFGVRRNLRQVIRRARTVIPRVLMGVRVSHRDRGSREAHDGGDQQPTQARGNRSKHEMKVRADGSAATVCFAGDTGCAYQRVSAGGPVPARARATSLGSAQNAPVRSPELSRRPNWNPPPSGSTGTPKSNR